MSLFKFFERKREKPDINWVKFPDLNWQKVQDEPGCIKWQEPKGASMLSINFFELKPDIAVPIQDVKGMRDQYRQAIAGANGGLIKLEVEKIQGLPIIDLIIKLPMISFGMCYIGSMTIPFRDYSYVIKIESAEQGVTGMRDSVILSKLMSEENLTSDENGLQGWFKDPYEDSFKGGILMNLSERPEYDIKFPTHPLSIVRSKLHFIKEHLQFDKGIFDLAAF